MTESLWLLSARCGYGLMRNGYWMWHGGVSPEFGGSGETRNPCQAATAAR